MQIQVKHVNVLSGILLGALIWHFSPEVFGKKEPWDASVPLYVFCIFLSGIISAIPSPQHHWMGPLAVYLGQYAYIWSVHGPGNLWPLSLVFGFVFLFPAFVGSFMVYFIYKFINRNRRDNTG